MLLYPEHCQLLCFCQSEKMSCLPIGVWLKRNRKQSSEVNIKENEELKNNSMLSLDSLPKQDRFESICSWLQTSDDNIPLGSETDDGYSDVSDEEFKHIFRIKRRSLRSMHPIKIQEDFHQSSLFLQKMTDSELFENGVTHSKVIGISTCV